MSLLRLLRHSAFVIGHFAFVLGVFAENAPPPVVSLRFLFLDETAGAYWLKTGGAWQRLTTTPYAVSQPVTAKPETRLEIFKDGPHADPVTGQPVRIKAVTLPAPAGTAASLVVISPRPAASADAAPVWDVTLFDDDPRAFPARSIRILNLGHAAMAAQFGSAQVVALPGESHVLLPDTDHRNRVFGKIAVATSAGWRLLYDNVTIVRPGERLTGIFVYSSSGLRHTYTDGELEDRGPPPPGHFWLTYSNSL